jgi:hypothetical protein
MHSLFESLEFLIPYHGKVPANTLQQHVTLGSALSGASRWNGAAHIFEKQYIGKLTHQRFSIK